jgi:AraC-like DNA-binding protein
VLLAAYAAHLVEVSSRFGVEADELLGPLGLEVGALLDPATRLDAEQIVSLIERARMLTGEPGLGVYLGLAMRASWHGYLGFAVLTAKDVGDALRMGERYVATRTTALAFKLTVEHGEAAVSVQESAAFGSARDVVLLAVLLGFASIGQALTGKELEGRVELALPRPDWFERLTREVPRLERVRWGCGAHRLVFDAGLLQMPFQLADPTAQKLAADQCEKELAALDVSSGFSARVRERVLGEAGVNEVDAVAKALAVSTRTLKRRLAAEGTSYSELLEAERRARAEHLLKNTTRSVKEIAAALGYADTAAFSHAYTRWTGKSPTAGRPGS